ncbi:hypothetical protein EOD39_8035 [Acipenser ruthenus]|uniref:Uncharacterized protein n=1 Tax=Acipenser ruthenus TaxID=7906 RepID=A0A444U4W4_ACIRT|nr:hypothetical protein EOD39_8035 [Acipenser ruthenus]
MSPPDTYALRQDVNKGAYYSQLQYDATQEDLTVEAFVRGLTLTALRQQLQLAATTSLELEEVEHDPASGSERSQQKRRPDHTPRRTCMAQASEEKAPDSVLDPTWPTELITLRAHHPADSPATYSATAQQGVLHRNT